jgi:hypothetical protein
MLSTRRPSFAIATRPVPSPDDQRTGVVHFLVEQLRRSTGLQAKVAELEKEAAALRARHAELDGVRRRELERCADLGRQLEAAIEASKVAGVENALLRERDAVARADLVALRAELAALRAPVVGAKRARAEACPGAGKWSRALHAAVATTAALVEAHEREDGRLLEKRVRRLGGLVQGIRHLRRAGGNLTPQK